MSILNHQKFWQIYQYIKYSYIKVPQSIRKRIQLEAQEYVPLNDILCNINNTDNKNQFASNLLIVWYSINIIIIY